MFLIKELGHVKVVVWLTFSGGIVCYAVHQPPPPESLKDRRLGSAMTRASPRSLTLDDYKEQKSRPDLAGVTCPDLEVHVSMHVIRWIVAGTGPQPKPIQCVEEPAIAECILRKTTPKEVLIKL
jgi:hypothetical protein